MEPFLPVIALTALAVILLIVQLLRPRGDAALREKLDALRGDSERVERALREEQRTGRAELADTLDRLGNQIRERLGGLTADNEKRLNEVRATLDTQLKALQADNTAQLDKMRATVDEKLQATLNARLTASFKQVNDNLTAVQQGLGEMRSLATGVGDLKRVLSNVKTRGTFGEVGLHALLEDLLTSDQYAANVATVPGSRDRVEFAIRLPGQDRDTPVWLPIDAKFPREDFERLRDAQEHADAAAELAARLALAKRVESEAQDIHDKYIAPPHTTDFAILFLATESLYAEALRHPGLFETLQRKYRVTLAGPTTLTAIVNALQMGFRTLAIEKRSSEVWQVLGAVKGEFEKFGGMLEAAIRQVDTVRNTLKKATGKTTTIGHRLRGVESLSAEDTQSLMGPSIGDDEGDEDSEQA